MAKRIPNKSLNLSNFRKKYFDYILCISRPCSPEKQKQEEMDTDIDINIGIDR